VLVASTPAGHRLHRFDASDGSAPSFVASSPLVEPAAAAPIAGIGSKRTTGWRRSTSHTSPLVAVVVTARVPMSPVT
jgi:hypothetical protein